MSIGGIQTYIRLLIDVIKKSKMNPIVLQYASVDFKNNYDDVDVFGVYVSDKWDKKKKNKILFNKCMEMYTEKDIVIFACETMSVKNNLKNTIGIQHGITWDVRGHEHYSRNKNLNFIFWRAIKAYKLAKRIENVNTLVGVDYNFLNWYRTQVAYTPIDVKVIPNCTDIYLGKKRNNEENIKIIFARRFQKYRGTRIFSDAIEKILSNYDNVSITFAGSGPEELYLKNRFSDNDKVDFITYESKDSIDIHSNYDIAVIPTVGSEGTSLSLLEAMSAKCAVIASNVGGMTNIVLDNYNGILVSPTSKEIYHALEKLIIDNELRNRLGKNAYDTVVTTFNRSLWEERWTEVLYNVI